MSHPPPPPRAHSQPAVPLGTAGSVFVATFLLTLLVAAWGLFAPASLEYAAKAALTFTTRTFGWFYMAVTAALLALSLFLLFGPYRTIRLGADDETPAYCYPAWLAMLFSAGMGIGLVFYGAAEPLLHFARPPHGLVDPLTPDAARIALRYSFFHWCLHPWSIYAIAALAIAYSQFRRGAGPLISATCEPLLGAHSRRFIGRSLDCFASLATVCGVATSLGLGALQINGGLASLAGLPSTPQSQLLIIAGVTVLFMASAISGLDRGILLLSYLNMILAGALLLFVLFAGPTVFILDALVTVIGSYFHNLIPMTFHLAPFTGNAWVRDWTLFYWAWWIAWCPFVGTFIARISRGRTIGEFVAGVLIVPSILGALWFAAFGGAALYSELRGPGGLVDAVNQDAAVAMFRLFDQLPAGSVAAALGVLLIVSFFVTSADSATFVLAMMTTGGSEEPPLWSKLAWGFAQAAIASALLLSGGLSALQTASIVAALPLAAILILMSLSLLKSLRADLAQTRRRSVSPRPAPRDLETKTIIPTPSAPSPPNLIPD